MRYADSASCPDCRSTLPGGTTACPACGLLVRHPVAVDLFRTLQRADALVADLRSLSHPLPSVPRSPQPPPPARERGGVRVASVPKILLGLGALCLLVAAVIFLAVSWSSLGVGGRTAALVGLTAGAAGCSCWLNRRRLRIAAESLLAVALGLLVLDLLGAESAGWLGEPSGGAMAILVGAVLTAVGTLAALSRPDGGSRLAVPQVAAALGLLVLYAGAVDVTGHPLLTGHAVVVVAGTTAWWVRDLLRVQARCLAAVGATAWTLTVILALVDALGRPSLETMWHAGAGWSLLTSAAVLVAAGRSLERPDLSIVGGGAGAVLATVALTIPSVDEGVRFFGVLALGVTAGWVAAQRLLPAAGRAVASAPAAAGSLILTTTTAVTATDAGTRVFGLGEPFGRSAGVRLTGPEVVGEPLLAVPSALVALAFVLVALRGRVARSTRAAVAALTAGGAGVVTLASYDVPLAAVVAALGGLALASTTLALGGPMRSDAVAAVGLVTSGVAVVVALPSAALTAVAAAVVAVAAGAAHLRGPTAHLRIVGGAGLPAGPALAVWAGGHATGYAAEALGVAVLLTVGLIAIARPRTPVEVSATVVGACAALVAVVEDLGSLALQLTVAGSLLCATALIHRSRRRTAYAGSGLLFVATWVRLAELGVSAPEPYTLPLAVALAVVGLVHLRRHPGADTATALVPGLLLGTLPSLLWVIADPVSLRALLLGTACLALAVAGAALRWSAPLVVGAGVGAAVVLRELGPYAGDAPQWVWIGLAGALLITVGITWERRLVELRTAVGLLGRLR